jgi:hypothetical protein
MRNIHDLLAEEADRHKPESVPPFHMVSRRARRRTLRNAGAALAAAAALVGVLAATTPLGEHATNRTLSGTDYTTALFNEGTFTFQYPSSWRSEPYQVFSSFFSIITYLSSDALHDPCSEPTPGQIHCASPLSALSAGGVLITWTRWGTIGHHDLSDQPGRQTTLDGHPALIDSTSATDYCADIGADQEIHAIIVLGSASEYDRWLDMRACLAEPDTAHSEQQIDAMLQSLRFETSASSGGGQVQPPSTVVSRSVIK